MEYTGTCKLVLGKNSKKVKCYKYKSEDLNREIVVHEDLDNKTTTSVSDFNSGLRLFGVKIDFKKVTEEDIQEGIKDFIKHYTMPLIEERFKEVDSQKETEDNGKQK